MSQSSDKTHDLDVLYSICRKVFEFERSLGHFANVLANEEQRLAEAHRRGMAKYLQSWLQEVGRNFRTVSASRMQQFAQHLTPDEGRLFRSICAVDRRVVTRAITRGRISNDREFEAVRAWVEEMEGQLPPHGQLTKAYELLEQYEPMSDR